MSDIGAKFNEYEKTYGRAPTAQQFSHFASVRYSDASKFIKKRTNTLNPPKPNLNISSNSSSPQNAMSQNLKQLQSDLTVLNENYERQCNKIQHQFEEMRNELTKKENEIISDLSKYHDDCRAIIEKNVSNMNTSKSTSVQKSKLSPAAIPFKFEKGKEEKKILQPQKEAENDDSARSSELLIKH